ncbi:MAG: cytochrome c [Luteimonas sp.]|nr:cytochrome c [Luteimonas sp.]
MKITRPKHWSAWLPLILLLLLAGVLIAAGGWWRWVADDRRLAAPSVAPQDAATIARGAYLAKLGSCAGCHTTSGGATFAGGRGIATPFGIVYAGNLTPDDATGLGRWSADDFWRAMHEGRGRDGRALVPAFPYTEFTKVTRGDSDALWAYLRSVPPASRPRREHELAFPYNTPLALEAWRAIYFERGAFEPEPARSADWNRGAYLAQGLGHCAACHAPRDRFGGPGDVPSGGLMAGERWWAPALYIHPREVESVVALLKTGQSAHGTAMGPMAEVVVWGTQHWSDADLNALAVYLQSLPPAPARPTAPAGATLPDRGQGLYANRCADCHGTRGEGVPGVYPPLAGNPSVLQVEPVNLVHAVRHGGFAPATLAHPRPFGMPPNDIDDAALADLLTFVRGSWGNDAPAVSALQVFHAR